MVGERCKRSGMRWTVDGVNTILAPRSCILSGSLEDYWARRAQAAWAQVGKSDVPLSSSSLRCHLATNYMIDI